MGDWGWLILSIALAGALWAAFLVYGYRLRSSMYDDLEGETEPQRDDSRRSGPPEGV